MFFNSKEQRERFSKRAKGVKQSPETIAKRIKNTDQKKKEKTRRETILKRYKDGKIPYKRDPNKIRKPLPPRTEEHQRKIIESKRKNDTLKHSNETKQKIKEKIRQVYESDDPPITISNSSNNSYKHGYYNGMYYRSSYELYFLIYCFENNIKVESAETKEFRLRYIDINGKMRMYYPDFYLPDYESIIEIKPLSMIDYKNNPIKIVAAATNYAFSLVTEEELSDLDGFFKWL